MKNIVENMKEYEGNMKKRVKICRKYEEICDSGTWKNEAPSEARCEPSCIPFSLYKCSGTWKNSLRSLDA